MSLPGGDKSDRPLPRSLAHMDPVEARLKCWDRKINGLRISAFLFSEFMTAPYVWFGISLALTVLRE